MEENMRNIDDVRKELIGNVELVTEIDLSTHTCINVFWDIEKDFEIEKFVRTNTPFFLKKKTGDIYGTIELYVPNTHLIVAEALDRSKYHRLFVDISGSMIHFLESTDKLKDVISRIPDGVWEVILFGANIVADVLVTDKSKIFNIISNHTTGGGILYDCLDDYSLWSKDYLLCDRHESLTKYMQGLKVFKEVWDESINTSGIVEII